MSLGKKSSLNSPVAWGRDATTYLNQSLNWSCCHRDLSSQVYSGSRSQLFIPSSNHGLTWNAWQPHHVQAQTPQMTFTLDSCSNYQLYHCIQTQQVTTHTLTHTSTPTNSCSYSTLPVVVAAAANVVDGSHRRLPTATVIITAMAIVQSIIT